MFSRIQEKTFYIYGALNIAWIPLVYLFWPEVLIFLCSFVCSYLMGNFRQQSARSSLSTGCSSHPCQSPGNKKHTIKVQRWSLTGCIITTMLTRRMVNSRKWSKVHLISRSTVALVPLFSSRIEGDHWEVQRHEVAMDLRRIFLIRLVLCAFT